MLGVTLASRGKNFANVRSLINLRADDLLICLSDPVISVPNLQNYIKSCSSLSRYTINRAESEFMPLNDNLSLALLNWLLLTLATLDFPETLHTEIVWIQRNFMLTSETCTLLPLFQGSRTFFKTFQSTYHCLFLSTLICRIAKAHSQQTGLAEFRH